MDILTQAGKEWLEDAAKMDPARKALLQVVLDYYIDFLKETRPDVVGTSIAFPIKGTEFYERVESRIIPDENWSSRNQNKLLFKGKYPRIYYWFAARWLVKAVNIDRMWRRSRRPSLRIAIESAKMLVARLGVAAVDAVSFRRTHPKKLAPTERHA